jgi:4-hydroxy-2-oxoheptanedioate aldolase
VSPLVLRDTLKAGGSATGLWAAIPSDFATELMVVPGVDYVCVDQQHGVIDYSTMVSMFRAIDARGAAPLTRVPVNEPSVIGRALDAGAHGVVVPLVSTRDEALAAVSACRYPPTGIRSFGPIRSALTLGSRDTAVLGDGMLCFVMVETRAGLENIDEIAGTPVLDGIYIGPADLALGLGLAPSLDKQDPEHVDAIQRILKACQANDIVPGIQCSSGRSASRYLSEGFRFVTFGKDSALLRDAARAEVTAALGGAASELEKEGYS